MGRSIELLLLLTCGADADYAGIAYAPDVDETIEDESSRAYLQLQQDVSLDALQVKLAASDVCRRCILVRFLVVDLRQQKRITSLADFARGIARVPLSDHPGSLGPDVDRRLRA